MNIFKGNKVQTDTAVQSYRLHLEYLQNRLEKVRIMFDLETEPMKIEALIYEEKAIMLRIDELIHSAKQKKLNLSENYSETAT